MKICKVFITLCMVIGFSITSMSAKVAEVTQTSIAQVGISKEDAQVLFGTEKANVEVLTQRKWEKQKVNFGGSFLLVW